MRRVALALAAAALALAVGCAVRPAVPEAPRDAAGRVPFVWPRDGAVAWLACRFEPARPIGFVVAGATREEATAAEAALRAWERAGLGLRFLEAPRADAQLEIAFGDAALPGAGRTVADCRLDGERAEIARARIEIARSLAGSGRGAARALAREELLGVLAREVGHALGWMGAAPARDPVGARTAHDLARVGDGIRSGAAFDSPALRALYVEPSGAVLARSPAVPSAATRPLDRLAALARANGFVGPFLRAGAGAGRVYWSDPRTGDEYGAQVFSVGPSPGHVRIALESRARRALPRSRDASPLAPPPASSTPAPRPPR